MPVVDTTVVRTQSRRMLQACGTPDSAAYIVVESLMEASLRGYDVLGIARLPGYIQSIRTGGIVPNGMPEIVDETAVALRVDGHRGFGHVAAAQAMGRGVRKAQQQGIASALVFNCGPADLLTNYVEMATERDCIGLACVSDAATMLMNGNDPLRAAHQLAGASQFALAFPTDVLMAILFDDVQEIVDKTACNNPMLSLLTHIVGKMLAGDATSSQVTEPTTENGLFLLALPVEAFCDVDTFTKGLAELREHSKQQRLTNESGQALLPGEVAYQTRKQRLANGIPLADDVWQAIQNENAWNIASC
jgi:LDH2 family malate/lactate/ureidoglycolate dehydrogenase